MWESSIFNFQFSKLREINLRPLTILGICWDLLGLILFSLDILLGSRTLISCMCDRASERARRASERVSTAAAAAVAAVAAAVSPSQSQALADNLSGMLPYVAKIKQSWDTHPLLYSICPK